MITCWVSRVGVAARFLCTTSVFGKLPWEYLPVLHQGIGRDGKGREGRNWRLVLGG